MMQAQKRRLGRGLAALIGDDVIEAASPEESRGLRHLPIELLPRIAQMKDGQIALIPSVHGAAVLQLIHSQPAPLTIEQATPMIEKFLANKKRVEVADAEVKRLRDRAKIEYVGDFESTRPSDASAKQTQLPVTTAADAQVEKR